MIDILPQHEKFLTKIAQAADKLQYPTYLIGGYVRDLLLKRPCKDIDVVCVGSGIQLAEQAARSIRNATQVTVFSNFGTAMFRVGDLEFEFVGARKESYNKESRNPMVVTGTLEDDQNRRDFTINSMAFSLNKKHYGALVDPFNGLKDIENKLIKTPLNPEITYNDDPLRMLRAIRFATKLNFKIDNSSLKSIESLSSRIKIISKERIIVELNKILLTDKPSIGFILLEKCGLLKYILPEITSLKGIDEIEGQTHKDNFYHTLEVLDNICQHTNDLWLRWAALLHDIGKAPTKRFSKKVGWTFHGHEFEGSKMVYHLFKRIKLPLNDKMKYVQKLVFMSSRPIVLAQDIVTDSAIRRLLFDAGDDIDDLMTLCDADITSKNEAKVKKYLNNFTNYQYFP